MPDRKTKYTFKMDILYRAYLERGQEFKPGLGAGVFASQNVTFTLSPGEIKTSLFHAALNSQGKQFLDSMFDVKARLVEVAGKAVDQPEEETTRTASAKLFQRYLEICELALKSGADDLRPGDPEDASLSHLAKLCGAAMEHLDDYPIDKSSRWLGFVQGVLVMRGLVTVKEERDISRPLFHAAYRAQGIVPPATLRLKAAA